MDVLCKIASLSEEMIPVEVLMPLSGCSETLHGMSCTFSVTYIQERLMKTVNTVTCNR